MYASLTPTDNAFSTMFLFLNTPIWSLYLYTTFPIHIGSTHIMLRIRILLFIDRFWGAILSQPYTFLSLMSHVILVYNHVTLCDWRQYIHLLPSYSFII